jgi:hypothetical protein
MPAHVLVALVVLASALVVVPLGIFLAATHAGPLVAAGVIILLAVVMAAAAVTVKAVRDGRM